MLKFFSSFFAFVAVALAASAQSVRWEPGSGPLEYNQLSELSLVFDQCEPSGAVSVPAVTGLMFGSPTRSESSSFTVQNFKATSVRTVTLTYRVRPTERTTLTIPAFNVETDKGRLRVAAATFEVGDATAGQSGMALDDMARSRFTVPPGGVWAGEVFPVTYSLSAIKRYIYSFNKDFEWDPAPLMIEPWPNPEQIDAVLNNEQRASVIYKTRAYIRAPGDYALHPATQVVNISAGSTPFGPFSRPNVEPRMITSPRTDLTARPLPSPAPAGFAGAVGTFTLGSNVIPATATVGEPITWTLTLDGTGNWPDIAGLPPRSVSKDFRIVQPQAKRANKNDALFDASLTEDIVLIPTKPGSYTLGPVTYAVFNPSKGEYQTLTTKPVTVTVTAGAAAPAASSTPSLQTPAPDSTATGAQPLPPAPQLSVSLPRDPLPPAGTAATPISRTRLFIGLLSSVIVPVAVWLTLAFRRARATDPARPLREAHIRLSNTIGDIASSPDAVRLMAWQRDTAILFRLPQAVPTPASLPDETWSALWSEAERTLYGAAPLPADWSTRAGQALATRRAPAFSALQLFLPRNILPLLALLFCVLALPTFADDGRAAYAKGDFAAAEAAWTKSLATAPTDWTAHHNLALSLIQQNRAGEAAGHALAAFVQQPQNPSVRWHLAYAFKTAGTTPAALSPFLNGSPAATIARLASPARWQAALIASAWLGALAIALGLLGTYQKRPRKLLTIPLLVVSLVLALAAGISLHTYGTLADARAVVVVTPTTLRSIPTDLDTQKSTPLALGMIATTDKTFLGWQRIAFPDGQTGWVRSESLVPLWHTATAK